MPLPLPSEMWVPREGESLSPPVTATMRAQMMADSKKRRRQTERAKKWPVPGGWAKLHRSGRLEPN